jgi:hypothetical protein
MKDIKCILDIIELLDRNKIDKMEAYNLLTITNSKDIEKDIYTVLACNYANFDIPSEFVEKFKEELFNELVSIIEEKHDKDIPMICIMVYGELYSQVIANKYRKDGYDDKENNTK